MKCFFVFFRHFFSFEICKSHFYNIFKLAISKEWLSHILWDRAIDEYNFLIDFRVTHCACWIIFSNESTKTRFSVTVNFANKAVYQPVTYMRLGRLSSILTIIGVWILSVAICIPAAIDIETNSCYCTIKPTHFKIRLLEVIKLG